MKSFSVARNLVRRAASHQVTHNAPFVTVTQKRFARFEANQEARARTSGLVGENWEALKLLQNGDTHVYNNLLWKFVQNSNADLAKYYYREMIDSNVTPDIETFAIVLASSVLEKSPSRATYYLEEMIRQGFVPPKFFVSTLSKLFNGANEPSFAKAFDTLAAKADLKEADFRPLLEELNQKFRK